MPLTPEEIMRGDPIDALHQPDPVEMQEWMESVESSSANPLIMLWAGQSQVRSSGSSTGGDQEELDGIFFWDNDASDNSDTGFVEGTQYLTAEFGEPPLNITTDGGSSYSNSLAFQAAKQIRLNTGRPVYVIQVSIGGINIESFIDPTVVTANSWHTPDADMYQFMYPGIRNAINAVPDRTGTAVDAFVWIHGGANREDMVETHAQKFVTLCEELRDSDIIDLEQTPIASSEITTYGEREYRERQYNAMRSAQFTLPTLRVVRTINTETTDGLHFTGAFMKEAGRRIVGALGAQPVLHDATYEPLGLSVEDGFLSFCVGSSAETNALNGSRVPVLSPASTIQAVDHADLGWCYLRDAGTTGAIVTRKIFPVPVSAAAVFEIEATSPTDGSMRYEVYQYDEDGDYLSTVSNFFGGTTLTSFNDTPQKMVGRVFPYGSGMDEEFSEGAKYFSYAIRYGHGTADDTYFRMLDLRTETIPQTYGVGIRGDAPVIDDLDDQNTLSGRYKWLHATGSGTPPIASQNLYVDVHRYGTGFFIQEAKRWSDGSLLMLREWQNGSWSDWSMPGERFVTIADDSVATITPPRSGGWMSVTCDGYGDTPRKTHSGQFWYDVGTTLDIVDTTPAVSTMGDSVDTSTSNVTGTTGVDGNTTVAVQAGVIKIENRDGGNRTYQITFS